MLNALCKTLHMPNRKQNLKSYDHKCVLSKLSFVGFTIPYVSMPDCILLMLSRSKVFFSAGPRAVRPDAWRCFSSRINVAWLSFQPACTGNDGNLTNAIQTRKLCELLKGLEEPTRNNLSFLLENTLFTKESEEQAEPKNKSNTRIPNSVFLL